MKTIARDVLERINQLEEISIKKARDFAISHSPYAIDITEMAEEGMLSYRYTFDDESALIIDDEGYAYCCGDDEIVSSLGQGV